MFCTVPSVAPFPWDFVARKCAASTASNRRTCKGSSEQNTKYRCHTQLQKSMKACERQFVAWKGAVSCWRGTEYRSQTGASPRGESPRSFYCRWAAACHGCTASLAWLSLWYWIGRSAPSSCCPPESRTTSWGAPWSHGRTWDRDRIRTRLFGSLCASYQIQNASQKARYYPLHC